MLRRFTAYLVKVFDFSSWVDSLADEQPYPQVPTANVWRSLFILFCFRLGSFHALEQELRGPRRWQRWVGRRKPSADTLRYALERFDRQSVRTMLRGVSRSAWRRKAIHLRRGERLRVVALDGHELWASQHRCCPRCFDLEQVLPHEGEVAAARRLIQLILEDYSRLIGDRVLDDLPVL